jgi:hypothetical protein
MDDLATVDWGSLTHAYGSAEDIPDQLRALASADPVEGLQRELDDWVAGAPTGRIRATRAADAETREVTEERDAEKWALAAYDAVRRGVGVYPRGARLR